MCAPVKDVGQITWPNPIICPKPAMVDAIDWRLLTFPDKNRYGYTFLGLDNKYRDNDLSEIEFLMQRKYAKEFAEWEKSKHSDCADKVIPCLCYIAAMNEEGEKLE